MTTSLGTPWPPIDAATLQLLSAGYALSAIVYSAVELGVFDQLGRAPATAAQLAPRVGVHDASALERLLEALGALGILERDADGAYRNGAAAAAALTAEGPHSIVPAAVHHWRHFYPLFARLPDAVRTGRSQVRHWPFARDAGDDAYAALSRAPEEFRVLLESMEVSSRGVGADIAARLGLADARLVVDLGGGTGCVAREIARAAPHVRCVVVDLEPACAVARERVAADGLADRIECVVGDIRATPPATLAPADVVILSAVLADWDDATQAQILQGAHALLRPGGTLAISETLTADAGPPPVLPAVLSLCMLLVGGGRNFAPSTLQSRVEAAGFDVVRIHRNADRGLRDLLLARRG